MNDAPTPTTPADPNPNPDNRRRRRPREDDHDDHDDHDHDHDHAHAPDRFEEGQLRTEDDSTRPSTRVQRPPSLSQKAKEGLAQKLKFLSHLVYTLDTLVHAELCVLYYMEYGCSHT